MNPWTLLMRFLASIEEETLGTWSPMFPKLAAKYRNPENPSSGGVLGVRCDECGAKHQADELRDGFCSVECARDGSGQ